MSLALAETYRIETADTAEAGIRKVLGCHPDLILVDSQVPAADGTRLVRRLLAEEDLIPVPIVALTESGPAGKMPPCGRFDGRIGKPIDVPSLPGQVRALLEPAQPAPSDPLAGFVPPAAQAGGRLEQAFELLDAIDAGLPASQFATGTRTSLHCLAEAVGGFRHYELAEYLQQAERLSTAVTARARSRFQTIIRLCRELAQRGADMAPGMADLRLGYLEHRRAELGSLDLLLRDRNFSALRKAGHNLKGTGAAYGFTELTDIGRAIEAAARDGSATAVEGLLDRIEAYLSIVGPVKENHATGI
jgi:CheY-like chemotaxis protein/HPt (histidine-containing phosphotransfer) domain-containing protein